MLTTSTPETVNPVADACEAAKVPCISTTMPWEAWYFGRGAKPGQASPFNYLFHFCFGVAEFYKAYTHLWPQVAIHRRHQTDDQRGRQPTLRNEGGTAC